MRAAGKDRAISELSMVTLMHAVLEPGGERILPEGATGAVVFAYRDGSGYEVEFERPFHCVVTLERDDIRPV